MNKFTLIIAFFVIFSTFEQGFGQSTETNPGLPPVENVQSKSTGVNPNGFEYNLKNGSRSILLAPSAMHVDSRSGSYNNFCGLLNSCELGFTDWISLTGGVLASPLSFPFFLSVKSTHEIYPNLRVGGMLTYNSQFVEQSYITSTKHNGYCVTPTALVGYGSKDYNVSMSGSYMIGNGQIISMLRLWDFNTSNNKTTYNYGSSWIGTISGNARATNSIMVSAEVSYTVVGYLVAGGLRIENPRGSVWDVGLFSSAVQEYPLPYLGYTVNF